MKRNRLVVSLIALLFVLSTMALMPFWSFMRRLAMVLCLPAPKNWLIGSSAYSAAAKARSGTDLGEAQFLFLPVNGREDAIRIM